MYISDATMIASEISLAISIGIDFLVHSLMFYNKMMASIY